MKAAHPLALLGLALLAGCGKAGGEAEARRIEALESRVAALESRLAAQPADAAGLDGASFQELAARLDSRDALERLRAAQALGRRLAEMRIDALALLRTGSVRQREAVAVLLATKAVPEMAQDLLAAHAAPVNDDPRVRPWIDAALSRAGGAEAVDALVSDLAHRDEGVRSAAVEALGRLGDPRAAPALAMLAISGDGLAAGLAAGALRDLGAPAVMFLAASWDSYGPRDRVKLLSAIEPLRGPEADRFLQERLEDPSPLVALEAARVLGARGDMSGRDLALERLRNEDPAVARAARAALDAMETAPQ